jgi:hypothetical protein
VIVQLHVLWPQPVARPTGQQGLTDQSQSAEVDWFSWSPSMQIASRPDGVAKGPSQNTAPFLRINCDQSQLMRAYGAPLHGGLHGGLYQRAWSRLSVAEYQRKLARAGVTAKPLRSKPR